MEGMYWGDLRALIERNKRPWRYLRYYRAKHGFKDSMTICDYSWPRRRGFVKAGFIPEQENWAAQSILCNAGYYNGFIPYADNWANWDEEKNKFDGDVCRGVKGVLGKLVSTGTIYKSKEVRKWMGELT